MKKQEKMEMDMRTLAQVSGGTDITQDNSNNSGAQQNAQGGSNYNDVIQNNYICNNSGNVQIGSPVVIKNGDIYEVRPAC